MSASHSHSHSHTAWLLSAGRWRLLLQLVVVCWMANIVLLVGASKTRGFNYEIEKRVHERVSELMNIPITMLGIVESYLKTDIFEPPVLRPHQRDDFFRIVWTVYKDFDIDLYYGQEDGLFLGMINGAGTYQEGRGTNGYHLDDSLASEQDKYMKRLYYGECLVPETGGRQNCELSANETYVSCVNDCVLAPCPSLASEESDTMFLNASSSEATTAYCPTYEIRQVPAAADADGSTGMGYIPRYYYCLNNAGRFVENDPPNTVASPSIMKNGVCTHTDGTTLVDGKTLEKRTYAVADRRNYVFLHNYDHDNEHYDPATASGADDASPASAIHASETTTSAARLYSGIGIEDDQKTDRVFVGGYHSRRYEPRLRPWYIGTREVQAPFWTKPYTFATASDIGITFGKPLYYTDPSTGVKVFRGVLAVDYDLEEISRFLIDVFLEEHTDDAANEDLSTTTEGTPVTKTSHSSSSGATVLIVEDEEPHYIIGSSTGSKASKKVRIDDESIDCDDGEFWSGFDCTTVRSTPQDFARGGKRTNSGGGPSRDAIVASAFAAQKEAGFPKELVVSSPFPEGSSHSETLADGQSRFYISQSLIYEQSEGENLRWRIIVAMPVEIDTNDELLWGEPTTVVVLVVAVVGFTVCLALFYVYFSKRHIRQVALSDWRFTSAFLLGCAILNLTTLASLGRTSDASCMLRMWMFHLVIVSTLTPLLIKVWRIYKLVVSANRARRLSITNQKATLYTLPVILLQIFILTLFSIFDPAVMHSYVDVDGSSSREINICKHKTNAFEITQMIFIGALVSAGCTLAFKTRNFGSALGEAKQLLFAMYNVALVVIIIVLMGYFLDVGRKSLYVIRAIGVFWFTVFGSCAFVLPRLLQVKREQEIRQRTSTNPYNSNTYGNSGFPQIGRKTCSSVTPGENDGWGTSKGVGRSNDNLSFESDLVVDNVEEGGDRFGTIKSSGSESVPVPAVGDVFNGSESTCMVDSHSEVTEPLKDAEAARLERSIPFSKQLSIPSENEEISKDDNDEGSGSFS